MRISSKYKNIDVEINNKKKIVAEREVFKNTIQVLFPYKFIELSTLIYVYANDSSFIAL